MPQSPASAPRVALYARYSSDLQRQTSIADQLVGARERAAREGWPVVIEHADEGVSGATPIMLRPGGKALMADALAARFDVLIVEGLDRISRDMGEQDQVVKRLEYRGIRLIGTSDGYDTQAKGRKVMRVARGLVNELYLDDLRDKTHRGLAGQFARGLSAGGRSYGYRTEEAAGGRRLVIDEAEAANVRWIFEQAAEGHSPRAIAHQLNLRGIPSARGGTWAVSAIIGSNKRGLGMLNNELYVGRVIWNRRQWVKDPDTGSRRYVERPQSEWQTREAPELRIVPDELWQRVHSGASASPTRGVRKGRGAAPRTLFGGLLRCHACDGAIVAVDSRSYGCSVHKDRGATVCPNGSTWRRTVVDSRLIAEVRDALMSPAAIAELKTTTRALLSSAAREGAGGPDTAKKRLQVLRGEISRLVDAVASVGYSAALAGRLQQAEAEASALEAQLSQAQTSARAAADVVDQVAARYRRTLLQLQEALSDEADRQRTRHILADLLGPVTLVKDVATGESFAELEEPAERLLVAVSGQPLGRVARARNVSRRRIRL